MDAYNIRRCFCCGGEVTLQETPDATVISCQICSAETWYYNRRPLKALSRWNNRASADTQYGKIKPNNPRKNKLSREQALENKRQSHARYMERLRAGREAFFSNPDDERHGKRKGYDIGCRCERCIKYKEHKNRTNAECKRRKHEELQADMSHPDHGTARGYKYAGCRCDKCREWWRNVGKFKRRAAS